MEKSNLILKHLHFLKSNGRHILVFLKESIGWFHAKAEMWTSPSKNGAAGAGSMRGLFIERVALLSLKKTPEATSVFFHIWICCQRRRITDAWWGPNIKNLGGF